jgi:hypothetical protein
MVYYNMNIIKNVTFGLEGSTYGATGLGIIDGGQYWQLQV